MVRRLRSRRSWSGQSYADENDNFPDKDRLTAKAVAI